MASRSRKGADMGMGRIGWQRASGNDEGSQVADPWSDLSASRPLGAVSADDGISTIEWPPQQDAGPIVFEPSEVSASRISNAPVVIEVETPVIDQALSPSRDELRAWLHRSLITDFDHRGLTEMPLEEARLIVIAMARQIVDTDVPDSFDASRVQLLNELVDDIIGLGPIETLLRDSTVSEIMVNGAERIYVERFGRIELTDVEFRDNAHVM